MSRFSLVYLCIFSFLVSILSFFNIIYSNYLNLYLNIDSYVYSLIISFLIGLTFFLFKKKSQEYKISIYEKIGLVISAIVLLSLENFSTKTLTIKLSSSSFVRANTVST